MGGYALGHFRLSPTVRRSLNRCAGCGFALAILLMAAATWAGTYRWVDEQGRVHYGDSLPAQYAGQGHAELNEQGRVIRRVEKAPNSEQARALRARQEANKTSEERAERERQRMDNALLATYGNVREIDQAKQRALEQEQLLLDSLLAMRKLSKTKSDTDYIDSQVRQRQQALDTLRKKFDADRTRYLELTGGR